jgi:hypothetical protein
MQLADHGLSQADDLPGLLVMRLTVARPHAFLSLGANRLCGPCGRMPCRINLSVPAKIEMPNMSTLVQRHGSARVGVRVLTASSIYPKCGVR